MKWLAFISALLALSGFSVGLFARESRTLLLSESEVAPIRTALGYTTMLTFDGRPSSVILGDQDAFKVEYAGSGLAIKPLLPHAKTNLFIFTDYDRFNFRLLVGPPSEVDYAIRIKGKRSQSYDVQQTEKDSPALSALTVRKLGRKKVCSGLQLNVDSVAWPKSGSTYLVRFHVTASTDLKLSLEKQISFEPGDFDISQEGRSLPIENLYLEKLAFTKENKVVRGMLVLRQTEMKAGHPLTLNFAPDFLKKPRACLAVIFSAQTLPRSKKS